MALNVQELELQMVLSHHVGAENRGYLSSPLPTSLLWI